MNCNDTTGNCSYPEKLSGTVALTWQDWIRYIEATVICIGNFLLAAIILGHQKLRRKEMLPIAGLAIGDTIYGKYCKGSSIAP